MALFILCLVLSHSISSFFFQDFSIHNLVDIVGTPQLSTDLKMIALSKVWKRKKSKHKFCWVTFYNQKKPIFKGRKNSREKQGQVLTQLVNTSRPASESQATGHRSNELSQKRRRRRRRIQRFQRKCGTADFYSNEVCNRGQWLKGQ